MRRTSSILEIAVRSAIGRTGNDSRKIIQSDMYGTFGTPVPNFNKMFGSFGSRKSVLFQQDPYSFERSIVLERIHRRFLLKHKPVLNTVR